MMLSGIFGLDVVKMWSSYIVIGNDVVVALHGFVFIKKAPYWVLTFCFLVFCANCLYLFNNSLWLVDTFNPSWSLILTGCTLIVT